MKTTIKGAFATRGKIGSWVFRKSGTGVSYFFSETDMRDSLRLFLFPKGITVYRFTPFSLEVYFLTGEFYLTNSYRRTARVKTIAYTPATFYL
jgi:hypothetical protein